MKKVDLKKQGPHKRINWNAWKDHKSIFLVLIFLAGFDLSAQSQIPVVTVRFANPSYNCDTRTYCLDVEFNSDSSDQKVFGVNVRFFYDDYVLEYVSMEDFESGYEMPENPSVTTGSTGSGAPFGLSGQLEMFNGYVQLASQTNVEISTSGWTKLFSICFHVDHPYLQGIKTFCPAVIWDLQEYPNTQSGGGFLPGDDGVVITLVKPAAVHQQSVPTIEDVVQFNWEYNSTSTSYGIPSETDCLEVVCGTLIPVANWALFLGIGFMFMFSIFLYRRNLS
jgi:hypothetical protein